MSHLVLVRRYLSFRRHLGYALRSADLLLDFGRFADRVAPHQPLTLSLATAWATQPPTPRRATHAGRLGLVRGFARFCASYDSRTQIPDTYLLGSSFARVRPHIYTPSQIGLLLQRARKLQSWRSPLHPLTYESLIGLLACTGLRPGEALRLQLSDFDAGLHQLQVRPCKFSPARILPLHPSTVRALEHYQRARQTQFPFGEHFFVGATGRPLSLRRVERVFTRLARGFALTGQRTTARLLDFRHTFASRAIARWSQQSAPVSHHLLLLARYLGHRTFNSTWWYVSSDARALSAAADSFHRFHAASS